MNKIKPLLILGLLFITSSCNGIVKEKQMDEFFSSLGNTSITVYPTYVKRLATDSSGKFLGHDSDSSGYDTIQAEQLATFLRCECLGQVAVSNDNVPLGREWKPTQIGNWKTSTRYFGDYIKHHPVNTEYAMLAEYLITGEVWAVHAYVVNKKGEPVWGLHLNSHSDMFRSINPKIPAEATKVLLTFLQTGWPSTPTSCIVETRQEYKAKIQAGVLYDFESDLSSGKNKSGVPLGFSTFNDGSSKAAISTTKLHPPLPGKSDDNHVLKLDLNVTGWAGFVNTFGNEANDTWTSRNWSDLAGLSFWLYGRNSGTALFLDVMDNRKHCSTYDDAERYAYSFTDDFSGWKRINIQFSDMTRKEILNRAPDDGLGLNEVHGWGFGAANTGGQATYYIDDFELMR